MIKESREPISQDDRVFLTEMLNNTPQIFFQFMVEEFIYSEKVIEMMPQLNQALKQAHDYDKGIAIGGIPGQYDVMGPPALLGDDTLNNNFASLQSRINSETFNDYFVSVNDLTNRIKF